MKPTHKLNRRSFLGSVAGGVIGCGALGLVSGRARAIQVTDSDTGANADPAGRGRRAAAREPGDSDFARPVPMGDTFQSDRPPGPRTGLTDRDAGSGADPVGSGVGRNRQQIQAARCQGTRLRIARYEAMRPQTPDNRERIGALRQYFSSQRCR